MSALAERELPTPSFRLERSEAAQKVLLTVAGPGIIKGSTNTEWTLSVPSAAYGCTTAASFTQNGVDKSEPVDQITFTAHL